MPCFFLSFKQKAPHAAGPDSGINDIEVRDIEQAQDHLPVIVVTNGIRVILLQHERKRLVLHAMLAAGPRGKERCLPMASRGFRQGQHAIKRLSVMGIEKAAVLLVNVASNWRRKTHGFHARDVILGLCVRQGVRRRTEFEPVKREHVIELEPQVGKPLVMDGLFPFELGHKLFQPCLKLMQVFPLNVKA